MKNPFGFTKLTLDYNQGILFMMLNISRIFYSNPISYFTLNCLVQPEHFPQAKLEI